MLLAHVCAVPPLTANTRCPGGWVQDKMGWEHTIKLYIKWKYPQVSRMKVFWALAHHTTTQDWFDKVLLNNSRA